jgi:hypothetical protein
VTLGEIGLRRVSELSSGGDWILFKPRSVLFDFRCETDLTTGNVVGTLCIGFDGDSGEFRSGREVDR